MAITFNVTRERQRLMIPILAVLFVIIVFILYFGFFGVTSVPITLQIGKKAPSAEAFNIDFTFFDEPLEEKKQLVIYCPLIEKKDDKAEAALNLLKHTEHGLWVGLNNGTNAAIAAIEILNLDNSLEQQLIGYRKEIGDKVRLANK